METRLNAKRISIIYYLILMVIPICELLDGGNIIDLIYLLVLVVNTVYIIFFKR